MSARLLAVALLIACGDNIRPVEELGPVDDPLEWVDPRIGTGGWGFAYGSAFVGAAAPHGLVKLGPDTSGELGTVNFQHFSGYFSEDDTIDAFSHMHLHGTGAGDYGLIGVMPAAAFDPTRTRSELYKARFDKATESAAPGRYAVTLEPPAGTIEVELTATARAGHHRYRFSGDIATPTLVIDLARALDGGEITAASIELDREAATVRGHLHSEGRMTGGYGGHDLYFAARVRRPWSSHQSWADGDAEAGVSAQSGQAVGAALVFSPGEPIELQIGLSLVSAEGALANLEAEMPAWDFDGTADETAARWRELLSRILVEGGTVRTRRIFYSALYRSFLMPTINSDVDGSYVYGGVEARIEHGAFVSDLSLWDTYRTLHPLYHLIAPESGADAVRSLVAMAGAGRGFPRWPLANGESGTMLGASADVVLADARIKLGEIDGVDWEAALDSLTGAALDPALPPEQRGGRSPSDEYIELGYVPDTVGRSVSTNLEYAVDDHALAQMARLMGRDDVAATLAERSRSYRLLYDPATETFRPRRADGTFVPAGDDYSPLDFGEEFAEANALQMLWAPLHDPAGLAELLGGGDVLVERLDALFTEAAEELQANPLDVLLANATPRPFYWHGNEPDIHAAYLFAQVGRDDLTQRWLGWITGELYDDTPFGLAGNDDGGTLSSWYVWTALGIYPIAGSDRYMIGAPLFSRVRVTTPDGPLVIETEGSGEGVAGVSIDGAALEAPVLTHDRLGGSTLRFELATAPSVW